MAIPFVKAFDFEYGRCDQLSPLVQRVIADNPGPFTYTGTGVFIIGETSVCVIDPGPKTKSHAAALDKALAGRTVSHILLTHHHADHSPLAHPLAEAHGCKAYGRSVQQPLSDNKEVKLEAGYDPTFKPDIEIQDGQILRGEGWTIEALHTPGHTSNHICFALEEEKTLFSGDHIMGWSTSVVVPPDGHMGDYLKSLRKVYDQHYEIIRPTHGPAITDVDKFVEAYMQHREEREVQILNTIKSGVSDIFDIVETLYTHVDKRLYPAAAQSVLSHIIHLREKGMITAKGKDSLQQNYFDCDRPSPIRS